MRPVAGSGSATGSDRAVDRLRRDLQPTLLALDRAAGDLDSLDELASDLPGLQYALHVAAEGPLAPDSKPQAEEAYDELEYALAAARDETADVVETLADAGPAGVAPLLWEWRAALFGVRLALLRLERLGATDEQPQPLPGVSVRPLLLLGPGVALVLGGALAQIWPLWVLGLALVTASTGLSRRP